MYVSHNLNVDKVHYNYGGANHRLGEWMENIFVQASGFLIPSCIQLSERHWSLRVKWHFPTQQAHAHLRVRDFPIKLDIIIEKEGDIQGKKRSHHGNTEGQKSIERWQKTHTIRRHWQRHSWRINGATAGPSVTGRTQNRADCEWSQDKCE